MPRKKSQKTWDAKNPDKVKEYRQRYKENKFHATVVLEDWVRSQIYLDKEPDLAYGTWLRQMVEDWAKKKTEQI